MNRFVLGALAATLVAIAPLLGAADGGLPGAPADALPGAAEADASAGDLSYLLESTEPFDDSPPTGFTTEEYRTAVRNLVLADVARFSESDRLKDSDRSEIDLVVLNQMGSDDLTRDTEARKAMNALWYSRTAPEEIPAPAPPPATTTHFESSWSNNIFFECIHRSGLRSPRRRSDAKKIHSDGWRYRGCCPATHLAHWLRPGCSGSTGGGRCAHSSHRRLRELP